MAETTWNPRRLIDRRAQRGGLPGLGRVRWLGLAVLALFSRAGAPEPSAGTRGRIYVDDLKLTAGDILFRRGRSLISRAVLAADGHGEYSHVGLVALVADRPWVLHATPPEEPNIAGGVIAEPLALFLAPDRASAAAVYRPRDRRAARAAERIAWDYVHGTCGSTMTST